MFEGIRSFALAAALAIVYWIGYRHAAAIHSTLIQQRETILAQQHAEDLKSALDSQAKLQRELAQEKSRQKTIREQVKVYVHPEKDLYCGPSVGLVRLLNEARQPGYLSANPVGAPGRSEAPSGLGLSAIVDADLTAVEQYNQLAKKHNELIRLLKRDKPETD